MKNTGVNPNALNRDQLFGRWRSVRRYCMKLDYKQHLDLNGLPFQAPLGFDHGHIVIVFQ
jgi:hypothetical protein